MQSKVDKIANDGQKDQKDINREYSSDKHSIKKFSNQKKSNLESKLKKSAKHISKDYHQQKKLITQTYKNHKAKAKKAHKKNLKIKKKSSE